MTIRQQASESKPQISMSFAERVLAKKPKIDANEFESLDWVPCTCKVAELFLVKLDIVSQTTETPCYHIILKVKFSWQSTGTFGMSR